MTEIVAVYEKYAHLDRLLNDQQWLGDTVKDKIMFDLWQAIRNAVLTGTARHQDVRA